MCIYIYIYIDADRRATLVEDEHVGGAEVPHLAGLGRNSNYLITVSILIIKLMIMIIIIMKAAIIVI